MQVVDGHYLIRYNDTVHRHGLITSTLGLEMTVDARHFNNGAMRVKCLASISPVLWKGGKESVLQRRPGIIDNREAMLLGKCHAIHFIFLFIFSPSHHHTFGLSGIILQYSFICSCMLTKSLIFWCFRLTHVSDIAVGKGN